jgi:predicted nuclease with TOPRIM domain
MELTLDTSGGRSVEEGMKELVKGLNPIGRLETAMNVIGYSLDFGERLQDTVTEGWELVLREEWWRAEYETVEMFKARCRMTESVSAGMEGRRKRENLKRSWEEMIRKEWRGSLWRRCWKGI